VGVVVSVTVLVSVGGTGVKLGGMGVNVGVIGVQLGTEVKVRVGGIGVHVGGMGVHVGGIGVRLGVKVYVGGRKGVQVGWGVFVFVAVNGSVGLTITVAVNTPGGKVGPLVRLGITQGVTVAGIVAVNMGVMEAVGVGVGFSGVSVQASQPIQ